MLHLLDESIESFLRAQVPLGSQEIDVSFEAPDKEWAAQLNRPTVNLFLWDIARSTLRAESGFARREVNGQMMETWAPIPVEFRYLVTAWTSEHSDEHQLLGALLRTLLGARVLPAEYLTGELVMFGEPTMSTPSSADRVQTDLWKALDGQLKPGIEITLTLPIPASDPRELAAPTEEFGLSVANMRDPGAGSTTRRVAGEIKLPEAVGAVVRSPRGATKVNDAGNFLVRAKVGDEIVVETDPPRTVTVPESGGVRLT
ncbi:MAG: DUF4255 domain-containing protein [Acidimicrobiia bacterium]|nr:DUF4255 domain-containing protein [Acidimicrobiia bacterium]